MVLKALLERVISRWHVWGEPILLVINRTFTMVPISHSLPCCNAPPSYATDPKSYLDPVAQKSAVLRYKIENIIKKRGFHRDLVNS